MPNMQVTVWLRWKACMHLPSKSACSVVLINDFTNEIGFGLHFFCHSHAPQ